MEREQGLPPRQSPYFEFGPFRADPVEQTLLREGQTVPLTPKAFEILLMLLANPQRLLLKEEILRTVWPDTFVDEGNLTVQISTLRKTLGDSLIETVPRHGYRFLGTVTQVPRDGESALPRSRRRVWSIASTAAIVVAVVVLLVARRANREPAPVAPVQPIRSIAVLPFKPLAPSATDQYLGLGMADSLITRLSAMPHLVVRPTSAIRRYDRGDVDSVAAGRELQVDAVVEATVQRAENNVRVNARLLRVADGKSLWSEQFDAPAGGFFTVQDRVCENLATALVPTLTRERHALLKKRDTSNEQAYLAFVAGRYHFLQWTRNDWEKSVEHLNRAIALDPAYAAAYAALAHTYSVLGQQSSINRSTAGMKVRTAALKALQLDPTLAEAHEALATSYLYEARWREAHQEMLRAMALNPNSVGAHLQYPEFLSWTGQFDKSIAEARIARKIEPSSLFVNAQVGSRLYMARRYEEAAEDLRRVKALDPDFAPTLVGLGLVYTELGRHDEAIAELTRARAVEDSPERLGRVAGLGYAYGRAGRPAEARRILAELKERQKSRTIPAYNFALVHLGLGDIDETFRWLDRAAETRARVFLSIGVDPKFDAIRSDPRYAALVNRLDLPQPH